MSCGLCCSRRGALISAVENSRTHSDRARRDSSVEKFGNETVDLRDLDRRRRARSIEFEFAEVNECSAQADSSPAFQANQVH
jgi:hypothetical protein